MALTDKMIEVLTEDLPVHQRKGPGGTYPYIKGEDVIRQLNKAFGHAWSSEVIKSEEVYGQVLVMISLSVRPENSLQPIVHQGYGSAAIAKKRDTNEVIDIGNTYKSAYTGALKKAAEQFGIGLGKDSEDATDAQNSPGNFAPRVTNSPAPVRPMQASTPAPAARPVMNTTGPKPAFAPKPAQPTQAAPVASQAPAVPAISPSAQLDDKATDTQKNALKNISTIKGYSEQDMISQALKETRKDSFDLLTRKEAIEVMKHANGLSKK